MELTLEQRVELLEAKLIIAESQVLPETIANVNNHINRVQQDLAGHIQVLQGKVAVLESK